MNTYLGHPRTLLVARSEQTAFYCRACGVVQLKLRRAGIGVIGIILKTPDKSR